MTERRELSPRSDPAPDLVIFNAYVYSADADDNVYDAIAIKNDRIVCLGGSDELRKLAGVDTRLLDAQGRLVAPGFIDTHIHPSMHPGGFRDSVDLKSSHPSNIEEFKQRVSEKVAELGDGVWVRGWGYDEMKFEEKRHPTRSDLDAVSPRNPVIINHACGHVAVCNSLALSAGKITKETVDPPSGRIGKDEHGEPNGLLWNRAQWPVKVNLPEEPLSELRRSLVLSLAQISTWGLTSFHDAWAGAKVVRLYQDLLRDGKLDARVGVIMPVANKFEGDYLTELAESGIESGFGGNMLRVIGVKVAIDGMLRSKSAAVRAPYEQEDSNTGLIALPLDSLAEKCRKAAEAGLRMCIHAEGDRGIDSALDALESASPSRRVLVSDRIEHCGLCQSDQIDRMRILDVQASVSIGLLYDIGEGYVEALGEERSDSVYPLRSLLDAGVLASGNSDWPVSMGNPIFGIYAACTRKTIRGTVVGPRQRIDIKEAIKVYTINGARASDEGDEKGSLEVGKLGRPRRAL